MQAVRSNKALKILLATNGIVLMAGAMLGPIYALFVEQIGGSLLDASIAGAVFALVAGVTTILAGRRADKLPDNKKVIIIGYVIMAIGFLLYTQVTSMTMLLIVQVLLGLGEAIYSPAFDAQYSKHLDQGQSGTERGLRESINYFSIAIGAPIGGLLVTYFGFNTIFTCMAIMCCASVWYITSLPPHTL